MTCPDNRNSDMIILYKIKHRFARLVVISILFPALLVSGQEVIVNALLDSTRGMIGDQLKMHLRAESPAMTRIAFPVLQDTLTGSIEVIRKGNVDTLLNEPGRIILNQDVLITVFDTGSFEIPPLSFAFEAGQLRGTIKTTPVNFEILPLTVDTTIRDIRANMKAPLNIAEVVPYALILVALGLITIFIIYWIRKRKKISQAIPSRILSEPADILALRALEQLRKETWIQKQIKQYYIRLTEILRIYIEHRYNIMALEQTTDEILDSLKKSIGPDQELKRLGNILKLADLVKFAKVIPDQDENSNQLNESVEFVKNTAPTKEVLKQESPNENEPVHNHIET